MRKLLIWLQIFLQLTLPVVFSSFPANAARSPFSADRDQDHAEMSLLPSNGNNTYNNEDTGGDATGMATGMATTTVSNNIEDWLNQFGTARVNMRVNKDFTLKDSSLDLLLPLYNTPEDVVFSQIGARDNDNRFTTNIGLGHRHFFNSWMIGYNAFYDTTWNNVNRRYGVGLELWRDNLRFSSNLYRGISGWHASNKHEGYDERPADGWDIRAEGWLPQYPQLGAKAIYEQYYGQQVDLFDSFDERQKNPHALTVGLNYTPVPLVTVGVDEKMGKNGINDTQINLAVNYRFGEPWSKQISPDSIKSLRQLGNGRLDLVNRNNDIVLDYRKQDLLRLSFPPQITGEENAVFSFTPTVRSRYSVEKIVLNDTALTQAGGKIVSNKNGVITLQLPAWSGHPVHLSGVAYDSKGNHSNTAETQILVNRATVTPVLAVDKTTVTADGNDMATYTLTVTDSQGKPAANESVSWQTDFGALSSQTGTTDSNGHATVTLKSTVAGDAIVQATVAGQSASAEKVTFENAAPADDFGQPVLKNSQVANHAIMSLGGTYSKWITTYDNVKENDTIELNMICKLAGEPTEHTLNESYTATASDATAGKVSMGPYTEKLGGIETEQCFFTSTVTRPSTGVSKTSDQIWFVMDTNPS